MKLVFDSWFGEAPKYHPEQLAPGLAVEALNTKPGRDILEAWQAPLLRADFNPVPAGTRSMYLYEPTGAQAVWFHEDSMVEWASPAIPNDEFRFVIRTDEGYPKFTVIEKISGEPPYPSAYFRLGMGYPDEAEPLLAFLPNDADRDTPANDPFGDIAAQGSTDMPIWDDEWDELLDDLDTRSTEYKLTFVDEYGRESAGSIPSQRIDIVIYQNTLKEFPIVTLPGIWVGDQPEAANGFFRIYRSNTGTLGAAFQFLVDVPMNRANTDWVDATLSADLGEVIPTDSWIGPPDDDEELYPNGPMRNVIAHPAGFLVGHTTHEMIFGEPYTVHAFPSFYRQSFSEEIIGIVSNGNEVFVGTTGTPMVMTGIHPKGMSPIRLSQPYPALSADGMTEVSGRVFYTSDTGLIAVSGHSAENVSSAYIMEDDWKALQPETMRLSNYDNRLFIFTESNGTFVYNPDTPEQGFRKNSINPEAYYATPKDGVLAFREAAHTDGDVYSFGRDIDNKQAYSYQSRVFKSLAAISFNCCKVFANDYTDIEFTLHGAAENGYTVEEVITVPSNSWFYLPTLPRCERWWISVTGSGEIRTIELATSPKELN